MTTIRGRIAIAAIAVLLALLAGCSSSEEPASPTQSTPSEEQGAVGTADDEAGAELEVPTTTETPESIPALTLPPLSDPPHSVSLPWGNFSLATRISDRLFSGDGLRFAFSSSDRSSARSMAFEQGWSIGIDEVETLKSAEIAARVVGPAVVDEAAQADELVALAESGNVDCVVVDAPSTGRVADAIDEVVAAGVPVFTVGTDAPNSRRFAYYGLDGLEAGKFAGMYAGQWSLDSRILIRKAAVLAGDPSQASTSKRMEGFIEAFLEIQPHVEFVGDHESVEPAGTDAEAVYEWSAAWLEAHPDVDMVFFADDGLEAFSRAIADVYLHGDVFAIGFGMSQTIGNLIHDGVIVAALLEGHDSQAAAGARACGDFLLDGVNDVGVVSRLPGVVHEDNLTASGWEPPQGG